MSSVSPTDKVDIAEALAKWMETFAVRSWQDGMSFVKAKGLSMPQFGAMMHVYHHGRIGVSDIGGHMEITSAAASQLVDRLVQQGLVERREDPSDRRARTLTLTQRGRLLVEEGMRERYRWIQDMVPELSPESRAIIAAALPALMDAARKYEAKRD